LIPRCSPLVLVRLWCGTRTTLRNVLIRSSIWIGQRRS
jgi:hypothetical protein